MGKLEKVVIEENEGIPTQRFNIRDFDTININVDDEAKQKSPLKKRSSTKKVKKVKIDRDHSYEPEQPKIDNYDIILKQIKLKEEIQRSPPTTK